MTELFILNNNEHTNNMDNVIHIIKRERHPTFYIGTHLVDSRWTMIKGGVTYQCDPFENIEQFEILHDVIDVIAPNDGMTVVETTIYEIKW